MLQAFALGALFRGGGDVVREMHGNPECNVLIADWDSKIATRTLQMASPPVMVDPNEPPGNQKGAEHPLSTTSGGKNQH